MNWGVKIFLALAVLMTAIVCAGVYMVSKDTDTLEDGDYYEKGLMYDERYGRRQNLQEDSAQPEISTAHDTLSIRFTKGDNKGDILLRRPSDQAQDVNIPFVISGDTFRLPLNTFSRGAWQLLLEWESDGTPYYYEMNLYL